MENEILENQNIEVPESEEVDITNNNEIEMAHTDEAKKMSPDKSIISGTKERDNNKKKLLRNLIDSYGIIWTLSLSIIGAIIVLIVLTSDTIDVGSGGLLSSFNLARENAKNETKQKYYDYYYEKGEEKYHISNSTEIVVSDLQEKAKLEVLRVCETDYIIKDKGSNELGADIWMKYIAHGTYTIDMTRAEFIVDDVHNSIKVRVPRPRITDFNIDTESKLLYKKGIHSNDYSDSFSLEEKLKQEASEKLKQAMLNNQDYISSADEHGIQIIENLVRNVNVNNKELVIIIEYVE